MCIIFPIVISRFGFFRVKVFLMWPQLLGFKITHSAKAFLFLILSSPPDKHHHVPRNHKQCAYNILRVLFLLKKEQKKYTEIFIWWTNLIYVLFFLFLGSNIQKVKYEVWVRTITCDKPRSFRWGRRRLSLYAVCRISLLTHRLRKDFSRGQFPKFLSFRNKCKNVIIL